MHEYKFYVYALSSRSRTLYVGFTTKPWGARNAASRESTGFVHSSL